MKKLMTEEDIENLKEVEEDYLELCAHLHKHWDELPPKFAESINCMVYKRYEP